LLTVEYNHTDYEDQLKHFAQCFGAKVVDGVLQIPHKYGSGYMRLIHLPNGLQGILSDYTVNQDTLFQRKKITQDYYTLRFDEVQMGAMPTDPALISKIRSAVFLTSTRFDGLFLTTKGTRVKGINIIFSKEWLEQFLGVEKVGSLIKKYLSLKMSAFNYEPMDAEYKRLLAETMVNDADRTFEMLIIQNRIMLLLERFFTRIYKKMSDLHFDIKLSGDDISRLMEVEAALVKDFSVPPPSISKLAKMAAMSPSKLKTSFKEIYGLPVYQYFQKHRMNKAKAMLLSKKYHVKEVGMEVGYSNLSNFAKAFKKSFDQLPSDILGDR